MTGEHTVKIQFHLASRAEIALQPTRRQGSYDEQQQRRKFVQQAIRKQLRGDRVDCPERPEVRTDGRIFHRTELLRTLP